MANCLTCQYLQKQQVKGKNFFHARCIKSIINNCGITYPRYIKSMVPLEGCTTVNSPNWCPLEGNEPKQMYINWVDKKDSWSVAPKHLSWDEIEVGGIYRIPKVMDKDAKTVKISSKTQYSIGARKLDSNGAETNVTIYLYPSDIEMNYIVGLKKF